MENIVILIEAEEREYTMSNRSIHTLLKNWDEECPLTREEAVEVLNLPEEEIDSLEEASALRDIAHMPARVKCAVLGWRTLKEALKEQK